MQFQKTEYMDQSRRFHDMMKLLLLCGNLILTCPAVFNCPLTSSYMVSWSLWEYDVAALQKHKLRPEKIYNVYDNNESGL